MKLAVATAILASSISTTSGSLRNHADGSLSTIRRDLSISSISNKESDATAVLKERRASKKLNGKVVHHLKNKLERTKLRNLAEQQTNELDVGALSRDLQGGQSNLTEGNELSTIIGDLYDLCTSNQTDPGFKCTCSNLDLEGYTATVSCEYAEECLAPTQNSCNDTMTFCFVETYNLDVISPGAGNSSICYDVVKPSTFSYCYGLTYNGVGEAPTGCFLELDGTKCNMCEFSVSSDNPNITCNDFDCNNVDTAISDGKICGDDTIVSQKIEEYLTYAALPCPGGCNICPLGGSMTNLDANVTMITGDSYYCYQLNLAAQLGYLENIPGDLCNALPAMVNDPCGCEGGTETETPTVPVVVPTITDGATTEAPVSTVAPTVIPDTESAVVSTEAPAALDPANTSESEPVEPASDPVSGTTPNNNYVLAVAAAVATTFGWIMI
mmetsp:Transcript_55024/g.61475  ORF Transcript_55024/g.61475 Transcript_55024/m.61475 type:complete len:441 (+) Transcript_55024:91-1413(+)